MAYGDRSNGGYGGSSAGYGGSSGGYGGSNGGGYSRDDRSHGSSRDSGRGGGYGGSSGGYGGSSRGGSRGGSGGKWDDGARLAKPTWNMSELPIFEKNFYQEHPEITNMAPYEVESYRSAKEMTVIGSDIPRPVLRSRSGQLP
ncbi:putative ATP-dependent RNA helicase ddx5 [Entomophthora muscae]|uniref:ATP-dependent RNA helicase ddx5 n=1 Tax=Entomophthora muscae TaxID=34485 RepID=A0ACC2T3Z0_9FUNG|nr:putative ATP-dependent RNA helicase ddx5 [Entomophthora muscae]